jgi:ferredoxin
MNGEPAGARAVVAGVAHAAVWDALDVVDRRIVGIHEESPGTCVVELDCGHRRHVRDRPPLERHAWVHDARARDARIGTPIECGWCDACVRPEGVRRYREGPSWDAGAIPAGLLASHRLRAGVWGELVVLEGRVRLRYLAPLDRELVLEAGAVAAIPPELPHELELLGDVRLRLDFYR